MFAVGVHRELCLKVIHHKRECELQGAKQHLEVTTHTHTHTHDALHSGSQSLSAVKCLLVLQNEQSLLFDTMKTELLEKIRRLEEDRQNIDFNSGTDEYQA